ncbi:beta-propeller domain-containing protein [Lysinibacillus sp. MHQ-1]|nr:beta-propeller domain-containing protein [Lysinibacillus sp. MHQ-1]
MLKAPRGGIAEEEMSSAKSEDKATTSNESTTNNQVEGVEEGDIVVVKDGFIFYCKRPKHYSC